MMLSREIEYGGYPDSSTRTISQKRADANKYAGIGIKGRRMKKVVDTGAPSNLECTQSHDAITETSVIRSRRMDLTLKNLSKNGKTAFYSGALLTQRFVVKSFTGGVAPQTIPVPDGIFEGPKAAKVKLSKEERAALRASQPKPTEAEKIARAEEKLAKRKAKLAEASSQPSL